MTFTPNPPFPKGPQDTIGSADWNPLVQEVLRLDTDKVNKAGDTMDGELQVSDQISFTAPNSAPMEILRPQDSVGVQPNTLMICMARRFIPDPMHPLPFHIPVPPLEYEFVVGHHMHIAGDDTFDFYAKQFSINQDGDLTCAGSKQGYVTDHFVNRVGDNLEQGDVVVICNDGTVRYQGTHNAIPVPEVDLTEKVYDTRVCGVVDTVVTERDLPFAPPQAGTSGREYRHPLQPFAAAGHEALVRTTIPDGQMGRMVTLGAFAYCKVDADIAPIEAGDLLTTSPTKGHAQKVLDAAQAGGAILGKALASLKEGKGKVPILVTLH